MLLLLSLSLSSSHIFLSSMMSNLRRVLSIKASNDFLFGDLLQTVQSIPFAVAVAFYFVVQRAKR